jgi:hypothetical protein
MRRGTVAVRQLGAAVELETGDDVVAPRELTDHPQVSGQQQALERERRDLAEAV